MSKNCKGAAREPQALIPLQRYADLKGRNARTIKNWSAEGILPPLIRIRNRLYVPADAEPKQTAAAT